VTPKIEWLKCRMSAHYFIHEYCCIYDATQRIWIPFRLWGAQVTALEAMVENNLTIVLKARQLGMTWLTLCYALWLMLFWPAAVVLLFSRRDDESVYLLDERLKGIYKRLPDWMKARAVLKDSSHTWSLSNGSEARAFPTSAGDSYTASLAIVDEADLIPELNQLMRAVKPTIDGGGRMVLLSRSDKSKPNSPFKNMYRGATKQENGWAPVFLSWRSRPERDDEWYERQRKDILSRTGSLDDLYEQYPNNDTEALMGRTTDKRFTPGWLEQCYFESPSVVVNGETKLASGVPTIPGLTLYRAPMPGKQYVGGVDTSEGNPTSNEGALTILERDTGEEVASLSGIYEPAVLAHHVDAVCTFYNNARPLVERNNHGHAVLLWLGEYSQLKLLSGDDTKAKKPGWNNNTRGKTLLYDLAAEALKDADTIIHSLETKHQLSSIDGATLKAPEGEPDDRADSYSLALAARTLRSGGGWSEVDL